jgi:hypothetical protein
MKLEAMARLINKSQNARPPSTVSLLLEITSLAT